MRIETTEVYRDWIDALKDRLTYRVYYTERAGVLIVLLAGGDKSTQQKDIRTAIALAKGLKE